MFGIALIAEKFLVRSTIISTREENEKVELNGGVAPTSRRRPINCLSIPTCLCRFATIKPKKEVLGRNYQSFLAKQQLLRNNKMQITTSAPRRGVRMVLQSVCSSTWSHKWVARRAELSTNKQLYDRAQTTSSTVVVLVVLVVRGRTAASRKDRQWTTATQKYLICIWINVCVCKLNHEPWIGTEMVVQLWSRASLRLGGWRECFYRGTNWVEFWI